MKVARAPLPVNDAASDYLIWRIRNVGPSAQFSDGDASGRLFVGGQPKQGKDAKPEVNPVGLSEQPERLGRNAKRPARPGEVPDTANVNERDLDGLRSAAKQKLSKRGKPGGDELPKIDAA